MVGLEYNANEILGGKICNKTFREFVIVSGLLKKKFCIIGIVLLTKQIYNGNRWIFYRPNVNFTMGRDGSLVMQFLKIKDGGR